MGLFSSSSSSSSSTSTSVDTPIKAPTRSERQACWTHRDGYFGCLTRHNITIPPGTDMSDGRSAPKPEDVERAKKAIEEDPCKTERRGYEENCARSWIDYFNKRRVLEERQRMMYAQGSSSGSKAAPATK